MNTKKNLVIVESPAKAKTIEKYLGKDFSVKSSFGHIRDLPKKGLSIDKDNNFEPLYEIPDDKKKVVSELKKQATSVDIVWLASDEDREGEAIAWHLSKALNLKKANTKRIVFHEITETAIKHAIANPRDIDIDLVNAQQARRVLDRLVGYELSPILWKKVQVGLSAGRVQSAAVKLIVDREREILAFEPKNSFKITATIEVENEQIQAELNERLKDEAQVNKFLEASKKAELTIADIAEKPSERNPSAPFTTSTLQQEAARKLGFSVKQTMTLAQRLYENGHITYMRTDSTNVSSLALKSTQTYIEQNFGKNYYKFRIYKTKNSSAQEAHEAIRPTNTNSLSAGENPGQQKLYKLIWRRMVASQMSAAKTLKTDVNITVEGQQYYFIAKGEVLKFDGYLKIYGGGKDDAILPVMVVGKHPIASLICAHQNFSRPPARYSEASLVKTLEELGIGRPSTYAPTISTIQSRGYIEKLDLEGEERVAIHFCLKNNVIHREEQPEVFGADRSKLIPTHLAEMVTDFLVKYFENIIDSGFTALAEQELDRVAEGRLIWQDAIGNFYKQFHPLIEKASQASRQETSQARLLGHDPKNKEPIYARFGRYGPMLQRGEVENNDEKPDFAPLPAGVRLEQVTLEQALTMFSLPRTVGKTSDGREIKANIGRFGPYIQIDKIFVSIKPLDPFSINLEQALDLYDKKLKTNAKREIKSFEGSKVQIVRGPYGPYVTNGVKNARIPKDIIPDTIDLKLAEEMLSKSVNKRKKTLRRNSKTSN
ncbi:MAG: type I DNA topoisomerase [Candidatus Saccharibacteria bacterium]